MWKQTIINPIGNTEIGDGLAKEKTLKVITKRYKMLDGNSKDLVKHVSDGSIIKRFEKKPGYKNDYNRVGLIMELRKLVRKTIVGRSPLRMFRAKDLYRVCLEQLEKDPDALLMKWDSFLVYFSLQLMNCFAHVHK